MILAAQCEAFKQENILAERLHGLDQQMERKGDESLYTMDRIWVLLVGSVMDEAHASRYLVHPGANKTYYNLGDMYCLRYLSKNEIESPWILSLNFQGQSSEYDVIWAMEWNSGDDQLRLRWMIYLVVLTDAAENVQRIENKAKTALTGVDLPRGLPRHGSWPIKGCHVAFLIIGLSVLGTVALRGSDTEGSRIGQRCQSEVRGTVPGGGWPIRVGHVASGACQSEEACVSTRSSGNTSGKSWTTRMSSSFFLSALIHASGQDVHFRLLALNFKNLAIRKRNTDNLLITID
ncbi:hypothetical protein Tco_1212017 [Tanacetum coccineum]